jgi:hypothetical protein
VEPAALGAEVLVAAVVGLVLARLHVRVVVLLRGGGTVIGWAAGLVLLVLVVGFALDGPDPG